MIALNRDARESSATVHDPFVSLLPSIQQQAQAAFRHFKPEAREELVQEVIANAYVAYCRLVELGKQELAYATPLAQYAIRQVRAGRRVGNQLNVHDVSSPYAKVARGICVERLDQFDDQAGEWRETLVEDPHAGPAETAAARIDIAVWFRSLSRRGQRLARVLARGESTTVAAAMFGVSSSRVSQWRRELETAWRQFQGEPAVD